MNDATSTRSHTKIAVLLRDDLEPWQRLNATAFLVSGIGARIPDVIGEPYRDADDVEYLPMFGQPVMVYAADKETLTAAHSRAVARELAIAVFTADLFTTGNDADNRAAVAAVGTFELDLVGIAMFGPKNRLDRAIKGARKHP